MNGINKSHKVQLETMAKELDKISQRGHWTNLIRCEAFLLFLLVGIIISMNEILFCDICSTQLLGKKHDIWNKIIKGRQFGNNQNELMSKAKEKKIVIFLKCSCLLVEKLMPKGEGRNSIP